MNGKKTRLSVNHWKIRQAVIKYVFLHSYSIYSKSVRKGSLHIDDWIKNDNETDPEIRIGFTDLN